MSAGDSYTEVSSQSWFARMGCAVVGMLFGMLFIVIALAMLFWNEGRAVRAARTLEEGEAVVVSVPADRVDPANDGRLVHVSGPATTTETLSDPEFGPSAAKALRLRRVVEMYQWHEVKHTHTQRRPGGAQVRTDTYTYQPGWSSQAIASHRFHQRAGHENPRSLPFASREWQARRVTLGAFVLTDRQVRAIHSEERLPVAPTWKPAAPKMDFTPLSAVLAAGTAPFPANIPWGMRSAKRRRDRAAPQTGLRVENGVLYQGRDPRQPAIGDVRIEFRVVKPTTVSLLARQTGDTFAPYPAKTGEEIDRLEVGTHSAAEMFQTAEREGTFGTWFLRGIGYVMLAFGVFFVLRPLAVAADVLPFVGGFVTLATAVVAGLVALGLALVATALGWVFYRPLVGAALLAGGLVLVGGIAMRARARRAKRADLAQPA
jgi:hypothetical protein